jgi:hypothetical protein
MVVYTEAEQAHLDAMRAFRARMGFSTSSTPKGAGQPPASPQSIKKVIMAKTAKSRIMAPSPDTHTHGHGWGVIDTSRRHDYNAGRLGEHRQISHEQARNVAAIIIKAVNMGGIMEDVYHEVLDAANHADKHAVDRIIERHRAALREAGKDDTAFLTERGLRKRGII